MVNETAIDAATVALNLFYILYCLLEEHCVIKIFCCAINLVCADIFQFPSVDMSLKKISRFKRHQIIMLFMYRLHTWNVILSFKNSVIFE